MKIVIGAILLLIGLLVASAAIHLLLALALPLLCLGVGAGVGFSAGQLKGRRQGRLLASESARRALP